MRRTVKQTVSALLAAVMLLSLSPVPRAKATGEDEFTSTVLYENNTGVEIEHEKDHTINIEEGIDPGTFSSDGYFCLTCTGNVTGTVQLILQNESWKGGYADSTLSNNTANFPYNDCLAAFSKEGAGNESATDLSTLKHIKVANWTNSTITVTKLEWLDKKTAPDDSGYKVKLTLSTPNQAIANNASESIFALADKSSVFNHKMITSGGKFRLTFSESVSGEVNLIYQNAEWGNWMTASGTASGTTLEIPYETIATGWKDHPLSELAYIKVENKSSSSITVTKLEWLGNTEFSSGEEETKHTVTIQATEGGSNDKNGTDYGFTKEAFKVGGSNASATTITVADGTKITIQGLVWVDANGKGDYLDSVKIDGAAQNITKGKNFEITVNKGMSIVADYSYLNAAPKGETVDKNVVAIGESVTTLESGSSYQWYRVVGNATENGDLISGATSKSYTATEKDKGYWLYCVIDGKSIAGPAAVVVSKTAKTIELPLNTENTTIAAGETGNIAAVPAEVMLVPGGQFKLTFESFSGSIDFVLDNNAWNRWKAISKTISSATSLTVSFDEIKTAWDSNVANVGQIRIKNNGSSTLKVTKLEWIGPDVGVEEAPYQPTDSLPFDGSPWEKDWITKTVDEDEEKNLLTATVKYDGGEWSVGRMKTHSDTGFVVGSNNMVSLNVYIEKGPMDTGKGEMLFQIIDCSSEYKLNTSGDENVVDVGETEYYRTALNIPVNFPERFHDFILAVRGKGSTFDGTILVENIILRENTNTPKENQITVNSPTISGDKTTVSVSSNNPKAYKGDAVKVTVGLDAKPQNDVEVTVTLNEKFETETVKIPHESFAEAQQAQRARARAARATTTYVATAEVPVPCTVGEVKNIEVEVKNTPTGSTATLNELAIVNKIPEVPTPSGGGGGGGGGASQDPVSLPYTWEFKRGLGGWKYEPGWNSDYSGASSTRAGTRDGRMEIEADWSKDGDKSWSQMAVTLWHNDGMAIKNATHASLDLYYLPDKLDGSLTMKLYSGGAGIDVEGSIDQDQAETVTIDGISYKKVKVDFDFSPIVSEKVHDMALCIIGRNTTYRGSLLIGGLTVEEAFAGSFVLSKRQPKKENSTLRAQQDALVTASGEEVKFPTEVTLADGQATAAVRSVYAYLQAMGGSKDVLFGQQYNFGQKAGSANLSDSDTYDVVGDYSAVYGLDALALTGDEFSAGRYNQMYGTPFPNTAEGNVVAAAYLTNTAIKRGAIVTLSCHMPNFSQVKEIAPNCAASYARYDFSGYTPNVLTGDVANQILPGGQYHDMFNAYLDMIADYANRVDGAVLFRPFHENTGSWFWWGADFCTPETYRSIYRYTVEYLRDEKGIHNFLYVYSPGSEAQSLTDYALRYPGDGYVDLVGFDMYNRDPDVNSGWLDDFKKELDLVSRFAADHGKLVAVTETGAANDTVEGDRQTALFRTGNKDKDWFRRVLDVVSDSPASYLLVWANFGQTNGFYTPYVIRVEGRRLYGHEMMDNFIDYYNDPRSIFASDQQRALSSVPAPAAKAAQDSRFLDVPAGAWYYGAVEYIAEKGIMSGIGSGLFAPSSTLTRAMMVQILYNMEDRPAAAGGSAFQDVEGGAWYAPAVSWAVSKELVSGYSGTQFGPEDGITREQMAVILFRYAQFLGTDTSGRDGLTGFSDSGTVSSWAREAVAWAVDQGIISGMPDGTLVPTGTATRAEAAAMLQRFLEGKTNQ